MFFQVVGYKVKQMDVQSKYLYNEKTGGEVETINGVTEQVRGALNWPGASYTRFPSTGVQISQFSEKMPTKGVCCSVQLTLGGWALMTTKNQNGTGYLCEVYLWSEHLAVMGRCAILWFRQKIRPRTTPCTHKVHEGLKGHIQCTHMAGCPRTTPH